MLPLDEYLPDLCPVNVVVDEDDLGARRSEPMRTRRNSSLSWVQRGWSSDPGGSLGPAEEAQDPAAK